MFKFSANLSTMFQEYPFLKRFQAAKSSGFKYIEIQNPYDYSAKQLAEEMGDLKCVLINSYSSDGSPGCASIPGKEFEFCNSLGKVTEFYHALGVQKVHLMSGLKDKNCTEEEQFNTYVKSLESVTDYLGDFNMTGVIEPICSEVIKDYFLSDFDMAVKVLEEVNNNNIKLLLDIYHLHKITGDVNSNLEKYYPYAGHIQISQDPGRREPFFPDGNIDYNSVFKFLEEKKHQDVIGLEYFPSESTEKSLEWMKKFC